MGLHPCRAPARSEKRPVQGQRLAARPAMAGAESIPWRAPLASKPWRSP